MLSRAGLPASFGWTAQLAVPATGADLIRKAIERGSAPTARVLAAADLPTATLAAELGLPTKLVDELLATPISAPLVVIDGEDSLISGAAARDQAIASTIEALTARGRPNGSDGSLVFFRTGDPEQALDVAAIVRGLRALDAAEALAGIVLPKVDRADRVAKLADSLEALERETGRSVGAIGLLLLVETAAGFAGLPHFVEAAGDRLTGLVFGAADYAADLGLPSAALDQPAAMLARARLVESAAVAGVPSFDAMTLAYPVAGPELRPDGRRRAVLEAMAQTYRDALNAFELGMAGKWVGHPAQLFAVELAARTFYAPDRLAAAAASIAALAEARRNGRGVAAFAGRMIDRATDRQARAFLARAAAAGRYDLAALPALAAADQPELRLQQAEVAGDG